MMTPCSLAVILTMVRFSVTVPPDVAVLQREDHFNLTVMEGDNLTLSCHVTNDSNPRVPDDGYSWRFRYQKDGLPLILEEKKKDLLIQAVNRSHSGRYDCDATNGVNATVRANADNTSIDVQVQYLDDHVILTPKDSETVNSGDTVSFTCNADSFPTAALIWIHEGVILRTVESNDDVFSFTATGCNDSGEFQCKAKNSFIKKTSHALTKLLVTNCAPVLKENSTSPPRVTAYIGDNVTLTVSVTAHPAPSFLWSGPSLSSPVPQSPSLTLYNLQPQQAGIYTVTVSNSHGFLTRTFAIEVTVPPDPDKEKPSSGEGTTPWMTVAGGVVAIQLCLAFVCLLLCRKRLACFRRQRKGSKRGEEHQYTGLYSGDGYDSAGRRRSQELADYTSGESTSHYWSIDSVDLSWQPQAIQPQAVQPQDSLSQVSEERGYDVPPPPVCMASRDTPVLRHQKPQSDSDVLATDDVTALIHSKCKRDVKEGETVDKASSLPRRCRRENRESDQESEVSESYLACQVISRGLPSSSLASHSSTPQDDYLTPVHMDVSGERRSSRPGHAGGFPLETGKKLKRGSSF